MKCFLFLLSFICIGLVACSAEAGQRVARHKSYERVKVSSGPSVRYRVRSSRVRTSCPGGRCN